MFRRVVTSSTQPQIWLIHVVRNLNDGDFNENVTSKYHFAFIILSRLFYLAHFLQFGRSALKINWYEQLQSENREWKILFHSHFDHFVVKTSRRPYAEWGV